VSLPFRAQTNTSGKVPFRYFDKGKNLGGLGFSAEWQDLFVNSANLRYGRFCTNKLNAGVQAGIGNNAGFSKTLMGGPFVRYYLLKKRLSPFAEAGYAFGIQGYRLGAAGTEKTEWNARTQVVFFGGGVAYTGILNRFGVELYSGYLRKYFRFMGNPTFAAYELAGNKFSCGLRANYFF